MKKLIFISLLLITGHSVSFSQTDFIHDNVLYKTLSPKNLKEFLSMNPNTILVYIRIPGEFADTSRYGHLNQIVCSDSRTYHNDVDIAYYGFLASNNIKLKISERCI